MESARCMRPGFIDAIGPGKCGTAKSATRHIYAAVGVSVAGEKDVLGLGSEPTVRAAKFWLAVLTAECGRVVDDISSCES
jgi:putative transposase